MGLCFDAYLGAADLERFAGSLWKFVVMIIFPRPETIMMVCICCNLYGKPRQVLFRVGVVWLVGAESPSIRVAAKQNNVPLYLDFYNDWYILKPATSNAVIIHTDCEQLTEKPHKVHQLPLSHTHDQSSASLTYSLDTLSRLLQCCPADTPSLINRPSCSHIISASQEVSLERIERRYGQQLP